MKLSLGRRRFLTLLAHVCGGAVLTSTTQFPLFAQDTNIDFKNLSASDTEKLFLMTRAIFPHKKIGAAPYWSIVKQFDIMCSDASFKELVIAGLEELDKAANHPWVDISSDKKVELLEAIQTGTFFQTIRILTLVNLYGNPEVAKQFGYQGSSYEYGGYLERGFNDLTWLPEPLS